MQKDQMAAPSLAGARLGKTAGGVLLAAAALSIFAMSHHPTGIGAAGSAAVMTLGGAIHATMIVVLAAMLFGLTIFSVRQGLGGLMLAGLLAYAIGFVGNLIAGTINGFIVPAVAAEVDRATSQDVFTALWLANQAMAKLGVYAAGAAFVFWSACLLRGRPLSNRIVGALGVLAGLAPALALYFGAISLDVDGALFAYGVQAAWIAVIGLQMTRSML